MENKIKFHEYKKEGIFDQVYELMLHIGLPIVVEILIDELWLHHAGYGEWVNLVIILSSVLLTLFFSVCILTPTIAYFKNIHVSKFNKWLKSTKLCFLRNDLIKDVEFHKKMKTVSKENYDWLIENSPKYKDSFYYADTFELEQNFFTREIVGFRNIHTLATGEMVSHSFEINKEHNLLKFNMSYASEITVESKLENPNLKNFEGRLVVIFNYKTNEIYFSYFINGEIEEGQDPMYGVMFDVKK